MAQLRWHFPEDTSIQIQGINSAKFDAKDSKIDSFVREACQNSCDAIAPGERRVRMEFSRFEMDTKDFPDRSGLLQTLERCKEYIKTQYENDTSATNKMSRMIDMMEQERITVLRISDYGTMGAYGSEKNATNENTPWRSMTISNGVSDKSGNEGGSFGKGKGSFFEVSELSTLFFSTYDRNGYRASIGCSEQITHYDNGIKKDNYGIYGNPDYKNNYSFPEELKFGGYVREVEEYGTDIYIIGYEDQGSNWDDMILISVIKSFFPLIMAEKLSVSIGDVVLDRNSLEGYLTNYAQRYTSETDRLKLIAEQIAILGAEPVYLDKNATLYLKKSENYGSISSVRSGMIIDSKYKTNPNVVGLFIITNPDTSKLLCKCEPIAHDKWSRRAISNANPVQKTKINDLLKSFDKIIKDQVEILCERTDGDSQNAEGIGEYLSYHKETTEQIEMSRKEYSWSPISKTKSRRKERKKRDELEDIPPSMTEQSEILDAIESDEEIERQNGAVDQKDEPRGDEARNFDPSPGGDMKRRFKSNATVVLTNVRSNYHPESSGIRYSIVFDVNKESEYYLRVGAMIDEKTVAEFVPIIEAYDGSGNRLESFDQRTIGPIQSKRGQRNKVMFILNYPSICKMMPEVFELEY